MLSLIRTGDRLSDLASSVVELRAYRGAQKIQSKTERQVQSEVTDPRESKIGKEEKGEDGKWGLDNGHWPIWPGQQQS